MSYLNTAEAAPRAGKRSPGRPRDADREAAIHLVVMEVVAEAGFTGLTFEEVARRARCSKTTLYRRWPTKKDMVVAAIKSGPAAGNRPAAISTGSLRGDLLALLGRLEMSMERSGGPLSLLLLQAGLEDPELCRHIEESAGPTGARLPENVLLMAVTRGELPSDADPFVYEEVAGAVLLIRKLNGLDTGGAYRELLVDAVLIPALRHSGPPAQHGIFSGSPNAATPASTKDSSQP